MRVGAVKRVGEVDGRVEGGTPLAPSLARRREPDCNTGGIWAVEGRGVLLFVLFVLFVLFFLMVVVSARSATASSMSTSIGEWREM